MIKQRLPDDGDGYDDAYNAGWNACYTAMLAAMNALDVDILGNPLVPKTTLTDGSPVTPDHAVINPATGMQKAYVVLSADERAKGFVRPVRNTYTHVKCGTATTMAHALAETYARDPYFYTGTFCAHCHDHFPVGEDGEFLWEGSTEKVGS